METLPTRRIDWASLPYGRLSDEEIARRLGVTRQAVGVRRRERKIPPAPPEATIPAGPLTAMEREDLAALESGLALLLDDERPHLALGTCHAVDRTPGWIAQSRRVKRADGQEGRATAFRFRAPGRRTWSEWMHPAGARTWLYQQGWADAAAARIEQLQRAASAHGAQA